MSPLWDPQEAKSTIYQGVEKHSEGMISFTYRPPSASDLKALKDTKTYRNLLREQPAALIQGTEKTIRKG